MESFLCLYSESTVDLNRLGAVFYIMSHMKFSHLVCWSASLNFPMHLNKLLSCIASGWDLQHSSELGFFYLFFYQLWGHKPCFCICEFAARCNKSQKHLINSRLPISAKVLGQVLGGSVVCTMPLLNNCNIISQRAYLSVEKKSTLYLTDLVTGCILHLKLN